MTSLQKKLIIMNVVVVAIASIVAIWIKMTSTTLVDPKGKPNKCYSTIFGYACPVWFGYALCILAVVLSVGLSITEYTKHNNKMKQLDDFIKKWKTISKKASE